MPMSALVPVTSLNTGWTWRERTGGHIHPSDMDTRHLFYTLRMIWNHAMPRHMTVGRNVKRWSFGPFYTAQYMGDAILYIGTELFGRTDVAPWMLAELDQIQAWLGDRRLPAVSP